MNCTGSENAASASTAITKNTWPIQSRSATLAGHLLKQRLGVVLQLDL